MSGYFIAHFSIIDPDGYARYAERVVPLIQAHHGQLLVADDEATVLEGAHEEGRVVVVEFPSVAEAKAWQASPEYRDVAEIRRASTHTHSMILVSAFEPPAA